MEAKSQKTSDRSEDAGTTMSAPLDALQMQAFEDDGAVLVDLGLNRDQLDRPEAAWDRHAGEGGAFLQIRITSS